MSDDDEPIFVTASDLSDLSEDAMLMMHKRTLDTALRSLFLVGFVLGVVSAALLGGLIFVVVPALWEQLYG